MTYAASSGPGAGGSAAGLPPGSASASTSSTGAVTRARTPVSAVTVTTAAGRASPSMNAMRSAG